MTTQDFIMFCLRGLTLYHTNNPQNVKYLILDINKFNIVTIPVVIYLCIIKWNVAIILPIILYYLLKTNKDRMNIKKGNQYTL